MSTYEMAAASRCSALSPPAKTALSAPMLRGAKGYACAYIVAQETLRLALSHIVGWEDTGGTPRWRCYMQMLLHVLVLPLCVVGGRYGAGLARCVSAGCEAG